VSNGIGVNDTCHMEETRWDHTEFASWLRAQLWRRRWNDAELTRRLGLASGTVSRWMSGERRPSSRSCYLIADLLGADIDLVLTLAGHRPGPAPAAPDDTRAALVALLQSVDLTPDRAAGLEATLQAWLEMDRARRE
jgi:transcriptional regulator with XRE-family HTH domain